MDRVVDPSSPRATAAYLIQLREPLARASRQRGEWVQRIGRLMDEARHGNPLSIAQSAGAIGREHGAKFREVRSQIAGMRVPPRCMSLQGALQRWLDKLIEACDLLVSVAHTGRVGYLRKTHQLFVEGRHHAQQFNSEYCRLVEDLRARVAAAGRRRAPRTATARSA